MNFLLIGLSTRALAESAIRSGHDISTLDYFGDQDQKSLVKNTSLARDIHCPFSAENLVAASEGLKFDSVMYTSNLENHPDAVQKLSKRAKVLGNGPDVLCRVRNWRVLSQACAAHDIPFPRTLFKGEEDLASPDLEWICKPFLSGGGHRIMPWSKGDLEPGFFLQEKINGIPASAAFAGDGEKGVILGITRQLIGDSKLGAGGYAWCGNILPLEMEHDDYRILVQALEKMVDLLVAKFGLKGVGGIDFMVSRTKDKQPKPVLIEINPRYTGAMELLEMAHGINIFDIHLNAFNKRLPKFPLTEAAPKKYCGKAIVFASKAFDVKDTTDWGEKGRHDIPFPGDTIARGRPICSILARGKNHRDCLTTLYKRAQDLQQEILA